jgi:NAD(P)H-dependent FMN reductase
MITPEYNGAASPALKNFFMYPEGELAHKPALLIGLSAGHGGAYPLAELRATSHKDTFIVYMPGNVVIREVRDRLKSNNSKVDKQIQARLDYSLKLLDQYALALKQVRNSGVVDAKNFPMGQ